MRGLALRAAACVALAVVTACGAYTTAIGPLKLTVPEGWRVSDREGDNLKLTDGTIADPNSTKPGTATAVFDIYVNSSQTPETFARYLREQHIKPVREKTRIDGYAAEFFRYSGSSVGGHQEALFVPRWRVFVLYRAAFLGADAAFFRGRGAFRRAMGSITFEGGSASPAGVERHGPTRGKSAITAIAAPIAIITNPS
jgi:hypothetical protein